MPKKFIEVARVGSTYGLEGELKLFPLANSIETILSYGTWYLKKQNSKDWQQLKDEHVFRRADKIYIKLADVDNEAFAKQYTNAMIGVPREALPELSTDEFYWSDLIGLNVYNEKRDSFGKIIDIMETGYNDVLICRKDEEEYLIPYISQYVLDISISKEEVLVDWEYDY